MTPQPAGRSAILSGGTPGYGGADILVTAVYTDEVPLAMRAAMPYMKQLVRVDVRPFEDSDGTILLSGDEALLDTGGVAFAIGDAFGGQVTDLWGFHIGTCSPAA